MTHKKHSKHLASPSYYARMQEAFSTKSSQLALSTSELDDIQKDQCWAEDPELKARAEELIKEIAAFTRYISSVQKSMDRARAIDQNIEQRRDLLLAGRETLLKSV